MSITDLKPVPGGINEGVSSAKQATMLALLGNPRGSYSQACQPVTQPNLAALMVTESVGPFRVTGLQPAVESLRGVMEAIQGEESEVYGALGTAGMLCARFVRGSTRSISNHSWGTAVDLTLNGVLDPRGDNLVQEGLIRIAPIFNRLGWYWGAAFGTEDGMHFEVCDERIREWYQGGLFGASAQPAPAPTLTIGDRGPEVRLLQSRLNGLGAGLVVDGDFGSATSAAVCDFQRTRGLVVDGIVGPNTRRALGI